jgi:hypothetical protein
MRHSSLEDLAQFCIDRLKDSEDVFIDTLYIAITDSNKVICSKTPHILWQANKCILLNLVSKGFYTINYIDEDGQVSDGNLGKGFKLMAPVFDSSRKPQIKLLYNKIVLYSFGLPWEDHMQKMWNLYLRAKSAGSEAEISLMANLIKKNDKILCLEDELANYKFDNQLLKQQISLYKELLEKISSIINSNREQI